MKITDIHLYRLRGEIPPGAMPWGTYRIGRQVGPLDVYPEYATRELSVPAPDEADEPQPIVHYYVAIDTDEGVSGLYGPLMLDQAFEIDVQLRPYLVGQDALAGERLWDIMYRQIRHGRKGHLILAISAVDLALWDLRGKAFGAPVYRLLGGPTRDRLPTYASTLGLPLDLEQAHARAQALKAEGFAAQKWFFRHGPGDGQQGMARNVALARTLREAVGDDYDLMFDAWMGWDVAYAVEMGRRLAPYHPRWVEEPVGPDQVEAYAEIRNKAGVPISGGEHEYTRWGVKALLDAGAVDVLQADPDWAGGLSELLRIAALASSYNRPLVPHGHTVVPNLHLLATQSPGTCPLLEYLLIHVERQQWFQETIYRPEGGYTALPTAPGLGIALDEAKVLEKEEMHWR